MNGRACRQPGQELALGGPGRAAPLGGRWSAHRPPLGAMPPGACRRQCRQRPRPSAPPCRARAPPRARDGDERHGVPPPGRGPVENRPRVAPRTRKRRPDGAPPQWRAPRHCDVRRCHAPRRGRWSERLGSPRRAQSLTRVGDTFPKRCQRLYLPPSALGSNCAGACPWRSGRPARRRSSRSAGPAPARVPDPAPGAPDRPRGAERGAVAVLGPAVSGRRAAHAALALALGCGRLGAHWARIPRPDAARAGVDRPRGRRRRGRARPRGAGGGRVSHRLGAGSGAAQHRRARSASRASRRAGWSRRGATSRSCACRRSR